MHTVIGTDPSFAISSHLSGTFKTSWNRYKINLKQTYVQNGSHLILIEKAGSYIQAQLVEKVLKLSSK